MWRHHRINKGTPEFGTPKIRDKVYELLMMKKWGNFDPEASSKEEEAAEEGQGDEQKAQTGKQRE
eukprot:4596377-Karenia_brevis.AAC.1